MTDRIPVTLTPIEIDIGILVGERRHYSSVARGHEDKHGLARQENAALHILGAHGEQAYCKWRGVYWAGTVDSFKGADVGNKVQVKTRSEHWHELIVRDDDDPNMCFVLVTGRAPHFLIRGWMWGHEAMQQDFRKRHGGREEAWFPPQSLLRSFFKLKETV